MSKEKEAPVYEDGYPAMRYRPSAHPKGFEHKIFNSSAEEKEHGQGWYKNPGDFGVEINPGKEPDPKILANKKAFESGKNEAPKLAPVEELSVKRGRPAKPKDPSAPTPKDSA